MGEPSQRGICVASKRRLSGQTWHAWKLPIACGGLLAPLQATSVQPEDLHDCSGLASSREGRTMYHSLQNAMALLTTNFQIGRSKHSEFGRAVSVKVHTFTKLVVHVRLKHAAKVNHRQPRRRGKWHC